MTLNTLILSEPSLSDAIASGNDGQIAQWLSTPSVTVPRGIPIHEFVAKLYDTGAFTAIKQAAMLGNATAAFAIDVLKDAKTLGIETIDMSLETNQSLLSALLAANIITQAQIDAVLTLATELVSPAQAECPSA